MARGRWRPRRRPSNRRAPRNRRHRGTVRCCAARRSRIRWRGIFRHSCRTGCGRRGLRRRAGHRESRPARRPGLRPDRCFRSGYGWLRCRQRWRHTEGGASAPGGQRSRCGTAGRSPPPRRGRTHRCCLRSEAVHVHPATPAYRHSGSCRRRRQGTARRGPRPVRGRRGAARQGPRHVRLRSPRRIARSAGQARRSDRAARHRHGPDPGPAAPRRWTAQGRSGQRVVQGRPAPRSPRAEPVKWTCQARRLRCPARCRA